MTTELDDARQEYYTAMDEQDELERRRQRGKVTVEDIVAGSIRLEMTKQRFFQLVHEKAKNGQHGK